MSENTNVVSEVAVEEKPKRKRAPRATVQKTGAEIIEEVKELEVQVGELSEEIAGLAVDGVIYDLAKEALETKQAELDKALNQVYKA